VYSGDLGWTAIRKAIARTLNSCCTGVWRGNCHPTSMRPMPWRMVRQRWKPSQRGRSWEK